MCPGAQLQPHTQLAPNPQGPGGHPWPLLCTSRVDGAGKPSGLQEAQVCHTDPSAPDSSSLAWLTSFQRGRADRAHPLLVQNQPAGPLCCTWRGPALAKTTPSLQGDPAPRGNSQQQDAASQTKGHLGRYFTEGGQPPLSWEPSGGRRWANRKGGLQACAVKRRETIV